MREFFAGVGLRQKAVLVWVSLALSGLSPGATIVAPTGFATTEGQESFGFSGQAITFQQVYGQALLQGLTTGDVITGMQFRSDAVLPIPPGAAISVSNFDVYLGPSNFRPGFLSDSVVANQGVGTTLTRNGPLNIPAGTYPRGGSPNEFGYFISFSTPHVYRGGDLLLTLSWSDHVGVLNFDAAFPLTGVQSRQGEGYNVATVADRADTYALVTQFTIVPEPRAALFLLGAFAAHQSNRRPRRQA